jgi:hypothetical protein
MRLSELMRQLNELRREVRNETSGWEDMGALARPDSSTEMEILTSLVTCLWQHAGGRAASQWLDCVRNDLIEDSRDSTGDMVHISEAVAEVMGKLESAIAIRAGHHRRAAHLLDDPKNGGCVQVEDDGMTVYEAAVDDPDDPDNDALMCEAFGFMGEEDVEHRKALDGHSVREPDENSEE